MWIRYIKVRTFDASTRYVHPPPLAKARRQIHACSQTHSPVLTIVGCAEGIQLTARLAISP